MSTHQEMFHTAWNSVFRRDTQVWKTLLLLALIGLIPIVGEIVILGFIAEWACSLAWGQNTAFARPIKFVHHLKLGFRVAVLYLLFTIAWMLFSTYVLSFFNDIPFFNIISYVLASVVSSIFTLCILRAAIYQNISAAWNFVFIKDMITRENNEFPLYLVTRFLVELIGCIVVAAVALLMMLPGFGVVAEVVTLYLSAASHGAQHIATALISGGIFDLLGKLLVALIITAYVVLIFANVVQALSMGVAAVWMSQFNVSTWGNKNASLPDDVASYNALAQYAPAAPAAGAAPAPGAAHEPTAVPAPVPEAAPTAGPAPEAAQPKDTASEPPAQQ